MNRLARIALVWLSALLPLAAQEADGDPELEKLDAEYAAAVNAARHELGERYLEVLLELQNELTRDNKLEDALAVKKERERIAELLKSNPVLAEGAKGDDASGSAESVRLGAAAAERSGQVTLLTHSKPILAAWRPGASSTWTLPSGMQPGNYELYAEFACGKLGGGNFTVDLGPAQSLNGSVVDTGLGWAGYVRRKIGDCRIGPEVPSLVVTAGEIPGRLLMNLAGLELVPPGARVSDPPARRQQTRNFEILAGAKIAPGREHGGDHFYVVHDGETLHFRLYFIDCPSSVDKSRQNGHTRRERSEFASHWGVTPEQTDALAVRATAFTTAQIGLKPFEIHTHWKTINRNVDLYYGFAFVEGEPLSRLLVQAGLARVASAGQVSLPDGTSTEAYAARLKVAEDTARSEKKGAWGLPKALPTQ